MFIEESFSIKLLLLDIDGVLTDGRIGYLNVEDEIKFFNVKDGFGIKLLVKSGIEVGVITGRRSLGLIRRCSDLGIKYLIDLVKDKSKAFDLMLMKTGVLASEIVYVGDDLSDLPIMCRVGIPVAVSDANEYVLKVAKIITTSVGGGGAIRELAEMILNLRGIKIY